MISVMSVAPLRAGPVAPVWIWSARGDRIGSEKMSATRQFSVSGVVERATLRATADFAGLEISVNGEAAITLDPYDPPQEIDVTRFLTAGENSLVAAASGTPGPSAIAVSLEVIREDGDPISVLTDASWKSDNVDRVRTLGPVQESRWAMNRLPDVSPFAEYNQWKEALGGGGSSFSPLPPGFEIEKIRDAGEGEDSWISLAIDPKGRLIIGKEQKGLLRLTLSDNGDEVVAAETIEDTLKECRGLVWSGDTLYAHANNSKALYSLRDKDGDDRFEEVTLIQSTEGGTGHGRNDLALHGGRVYVITGDDVQVPAESPRRARPEHGAPKELGHSIQQTTIDGKVRWEAMNRGLRNPYGIDFNPDGEAFTYDADNEGDVGLPFYRPTRINHLVSGANYGWHQERGNTRSFPVYAPDTVPTTYDVGRGSPTGVKFGTRSHFPSPWKESLFALDWAYGRIVAIHLTPNGSSYLGSGEVFLEGRPLNVTDLDFDEDGAMWFITGGRKTNSTLYRIRYTGEKKSAVSEVGEQARESSRFSAAAREVRKRLERFHGRIDPAAVAEVWPYLGDPDPWIRNAARVALEWQPVDQWRARALAGTAETGGLMAMLALARAGSDGDRREVSKAVSKLTVGNRASRIGKLTLMRIHELAGAPPTADERIMVAKHLLALLPDLSLAVHRELARGLIATEAPEALDSALERLASSTDQMERLHFLEALSEAKSGWEPEKRTRIFAALAHAKRFSYGDRFMLPFFQGLEQAALSSVGDKSEAEVLATLLSGDPAEEEVSSAARPFVKHWTMEDFPADEVVSAPDRTNGRVLFSAVLCSKCHVCGTSGRPVGPDLTTVASRFNRRDLIESIIDPSKVVADVHRNVIVTKTDDSVLQGRIVQNDFRESRLTLSVNPFAPSELVTVPKGEIRTWEESLISPMPPALIDSLSKEEINDLLGFLSAGGNVE